MIQQALVAGYDPPLRVVDGADFDGTNDYMTRGAGLTGAADSKTGIFSAWIRFDVAAGIYNFLWGATFESVRLNSGTVQIRVVMQNTGGTVILSMNHTQIISASSTTWRHVLASWDLAGSGTRFIYLDDAQSLNVPIFTNDTIDYTQANWGVGADTSGNDKMNGCFAELYFAPGQYLDLSLVANRRKFISASGKPVHLGSDGSLPTGTAPIVYCHLDDGEAVANFATNRGTGGNFTITGTLDTASNSPSD